MRFVTRIKASDSGFLRKCRSDAVMRRIHAKEGLEESYVLRLILIHDQGSKKRIQKEDESRARCEIDREGGRDTPFVRNTRLSAPLPRPVSFPMPPSSLSLDDDSPIPGGMLGPHDDRCDVPSS